MKEQNIRLLEEHKKKLYDTLIEYSINSYSYAAQDAYKVSADLVLNTPLFIKDEDSRND